MVKRGNASSCDPTSGPGFSVGSSLRNLGLGLREYPPRCTVIPRAWPHGFDQLVHPLVASTLSQGATEEASLTPISVTASVPLGLRFMVELKKAQSAAAARDEAERREGPTAGETVTRQPGVSSKKTD